MNNLSFIETLTVEQFKAQNHVSKLEVKRNPHTSKLFFTYGSQTGAVSSKGIPQKPMLSRVSDGEQEFWLLHEEGTGGAPTLATF